MAANGMIMVIDRATDEAEDIKELIEFMDAPDVCTATPANWQQCVGDNRLGAVFIGPDLTEPEIRNIVGGVAEVDPNIPIVMLHEGGDSA